ncbi:Fe(3+)-hydroxamate ABC transporter permease FhuB [Brucella sp. NM4]|uniref:Fe(3+)-hydroxamate ABC transporter permease FhuB n=1 Tax=Brucella/Ochrobactrum group TaxID=2826938 RepID=UPI0024BCD4F6|nr:Fe(3+)-hydroxamate ABC transporter permease FhuB [Brucella sp. NM4]WHS30086.1 Fe(3+)-hydroxamate ABC transporter permease FhuB [Brucella sp. NM4]WHT44430.1 Fe(3+)-hydroxamate ABC transporter permease FhuB [Ochrobactrum sp. SSR]
MTQRNFSVAAVVGIVAALALCLWNASAFLPFAQWPAVPFNPDKMNTQQVILAYAVLPRAAVAIFAGAALGLAGALLQRLLSNPIADPSTLGVSSGAQLAIVTATLFFPALLDEFRWAVALAGAGLATAIVFLLGWRSRLEPVTMVISGLLVGVTCNAISAAMTLSQGEYLMSLVTWNGGSLSQQDWSSAKVLAVQFVIGLVAAIMLSRPLTLIGIGDSSARALGVPLAWLRVAVVMVAVTLTASVAANVGLVSFIGLAAPAIVRGLGVRKPGTVLVAAPLAGAILLWLCDGGVQWLGSGLGETFPTGAVTALIGGPLLLWLIPRVRSSASAGGSSAIFARASATKAMFLLALLAIAAFLALSLVRTPDGWSLLTGRDFVELLPLRWPRLLAAAAAGSLLAMAGAILQRLTGNPLASPEVVGVSGGAGIGFAIALTLFATPNNFQLLVCAAIGAFAAMIVVLSFASQRHLSPNRLLLAGISVSSFASAVLSVFLAIGDQRSWQILAWLGGSSASATPDTGIFLAVLGVCVTLAALLLTRWLTILPLGQTTPVSLGLPVGMARMSTILLACIASAAASLLVGPLSFVGLMAPHMTRRMGFDRAASHVLASAILGALLMTIADLGARNATFPYELPLGLFAALVGAPYLASALGRKR